MHHTPHQTTAARRTGYQNAMLTAIAGLLALGLIERHNGSGDGFDRAMGTAQAQPQQSEGLANKLDQNKQIIAELRILNGKLDRIETKLSGPLTVKVTDMPPLKLPPDARGKADKPDADPKPEPKVEVKPSK